MKHYYSPSTRGFFNEEIHGKNIPADVVELSHEEWQAVLNEQSAGKRIVPGQGGRPVAVDPESVMTDAERAANLLRRRDSELRRTDWLVGRHRDEAEAGMPTTLASEKYVELQRWRSTLRALPTLTGYPRAPFPECPVK